MGDIAHIESCPASQNLAIHLSICGYVPSPPDVPFESPPRCVKESGYPLRVPMSPSSPQDVPFESPLRVPIEHPGCVKESGCPPDSPRLGIRMSPSIPPVAKS